MDIVVYTNRRQPHQIYWLDHFCAGLRVHGIKHDRRDYKNIIDCDLAVMWGHHFKDIIDRQRSKFKDYLVLERGFIYRDLYTHVGYNGLNGRADFLNKDMPHDRWDKLEKDLKPYNPDGTHFLVTGQILDDASTEHINIHDWAYGVQSELIERHIPFVFRPHPGHVGGLYSAENGIINAVREARGTITFNSNAGVDSLIEGTPVVAMDKGSMVYDMAWHNIEYLHALPKINRSSWANDIAYAQWNAEEMASGECWEHIGSKYESTI
jgi:hypothetical protein